MRQRNEDFLILMLISIDVEGGNDSKFPLMASDINSYYVHSLENLSP